MAGEWKKEGTPLSYLLGLWILEPGICIWFPEGCSSQQRNYLLSSSMPRWQSGSQGWGQRREHLEHFPPTPALQARQEVELLSKERSLEVLPTSKLLYFTCWSGVSPNTLICTCLALHPDGTGGGTLSSKKVLPGARSFPAPENLRW